MNILVVCAVTEAHKAQIRAAAGDNTVVFTAGDLSGTAVPVNVEKLAAAHVIIGNVAPPLLKHAKNLKWLQLNSAGAGSYVAPGVLRPGVFLTNATGAYGVAVAEHLLSQLLMMMKRLPAYCDNQKAEVWRDEGPVEGVYGSTAIIVGFGDIGARFGKALKAMGAHVIGIRRRSTYLVPEASEMGTMDKLADYAARADIIASALPDTAATRGVFNKNFFAAVKKGAYFLNAGRGTAVDQDALCDAVENGRLAGAALDVTMPEPLPAGHRLWQTPGVYITPHIAGGLHLLHTQNEIVNIGVRNLRAFLAGEPLINEVDFTTGYKK